MKKNLALLVFFFQFTFFVEGQVTWQKGYGWSGCMYGCAQTFDSGFVGTGISKNLNYADLIFINADENGDSIWTKNFHVDSAFFFGTYVLQTSDSGYIIVAKFNSDDIILIRADNNGDTLWTKHYRNCAPTNGTPLSETPDGGFIVTGIGNNSALGHSTLFLIRLDSSGNTIWTKNYFTSGSYDNSGVAVFLYGLNEYFVCGNMNSHLFIMKTDSAGDSLWTKTYSDFKSLDMKETSYSGYAIRGYNLTSGNSVARIDSLGNIFWIKNYQAPRPLSGFSFCAESDGGVIIGGIISDTMGIQNGFMFRTDSIGDIIWSKAYPSNGAGSHSINSTYDNGLISTGTTYLGHGSLVKTDSNGNLFCNETNYNVTATSTTDQIIYQNVEIDSVQILEKNVNIQIYFGEPISTVCSSVSISELSSLPSFTLSPNPTTSSFTITTDQSEIKSIDIFNLLGEKMYSTVLNKNEITILPGESVLWRINVETFPAGIYFVSMRTENGVAVQKLVKQ